MFLRNSNLGLVSALPLMTLALGALSVAASAGVTFQSIGDLAGGADSSKAYGCTNGGHVAGQGNGMGGLAVRWVNGTLTSLGDLAGGATISRGNGMNLAGDVVVGYGYPGEDAIATRWKIAANGAITMTNLGDLPGGLAVSRAYACSDSGNTVCGESSSAASGIQNTEAFWWQAAAGMVVMPDLAGGAVDSSARAMSWDSNVIVGYGNANNLALGREAVRWTGNPSVVQGLGALPTHTKSEARGVSNDGTVIVGFSKKGLTETLAFRWTAAGMVSLGDLAGGPVDSSANAANSNGTVVVGRGKVLAGTTPRDAAFIWTAGGGMKDLRGQLILQGAFAVLNWDLYEATAISPDGKTIVGHGKDGDGKLRGFVIRNYGDAVAIPGDLNFDGFCDASDLGLLLANWGVCQADDVCLGDLDEDGYVNASDMGMLLANWS